MDAVSLDQARAFAAVRQGLVGPGLRSMGAATRACACVYATAPTCYLGYSARMDGFTLGDLDRALYEERSHVRLRAMRGSSYCVPVDWLGAVVGATEGVTVGGLDRSLRYAGVAPADYVNWSARIEALMAGHGPMTKAQIKAELGPVKAGRADALNYVIAIMARECRVVRATVRGGWRSDSYLYALWEEWVGAPLQRLAFDEACTELARRYFEAFGPASVADFAWWAGLKLGPAREAVARLGDDLAAVDVEDAPCFVGAADLDALVAVEVDAARGARLLPVWDAWLMGWKDRRRFVRDDERPLIYDKAGNGTSVLLVDGAAAGIWEMEVARSGALAFRVAPFEALSGDAWTEVEAAARRIGASVGAPDVAVERIDRAPRRLIDSPARNAFLAPIRLGA